MQVRENIKNNIKVAAGVSICFYEVNKKKHGTMTIVRAFRTQEQTKLKFLQDPTQVNKDNNNKDERRDVHLETKEIIIWR